MTEDRTTTRGKQPIAWHPLFPAMLAVWFGALFGLGTLAVRTSLLESLALASHIDRIVPAAAPPLGMNARILIALALALVGAAIGGTVGTLMARSKPSARARRAETAAAKAAAKAARAEARIAAEASAPLAAAPDEALGFIDITALELDDSRIAAEPFAVAEATGDDEEQALAAEIEFEAEDEPEPKPARASAPAFERPLAPASFPLPDSFPVPGGAAAARLTAATLDSLSHVELIERLALSLQKRRQEAEELAAAEAPHAGDVEAALPVEPEARPQVPSYYPPAPEPIAARAAAPSPMAAADEADEDEPSAETEPSGAYASLLGIGRPAEAAKPVALFPESATTGHAAPQHDSAATERALRDALAALQRMSGAA